MCIFCLAVWFQKATFRTFLLQWFIVEEKILHSIKNKNFWLYNALLKCVAFGAKNLWLLYWGKSKFEVAMVLQQIKKA